MALIDEKRSAEFKAGNLALPATEIYMTLEALWRVCKAAENFIYAYESGGNYAVGNKDIGVWKDELKEAIAAVKRKETP